MNIVDAAKAALTIIDHNDVPMNDAVHNALNDLRKAYAESEGMVLVPSEPTAEMIKRAWVKVDETTDYKTQNNVARLIYLSMLAAAQVKP